MKVRDLKKILAQYPDDAPIFIYSELGECDGLLDKVSYDSPILEPDDDEEATAPFMYTPYHCQGDSEAEEYWSAYGPKAKILFLHATNKYYDFQYTKEREEILNELSRIHH